MPLHLCLIGPRRPTDLVYSTSLSYVMTTGGNLVGLDCTVLLTNLVDDGVACGACGTRITLVIGLDSSRLRIQNLLGLQLEFGLREVSVGANDVAAQCPVHLSGDRSC